MTDTTKIEWTHWPNTVGRVWNPTRGCSRISPGCGGAKGVGGCYAERQAYRFSGHGMPYEGLIQLGRQGPRWTGKVPLVVDKLGDPMRWRGRSTVFVNSMSDLFHESLSNEAIAAVFGVMAACPQHTFIVLTKRAERMHRWFAWVDEQGVPGDHVVATCAANIIDVDDLAPAWPLTNVVLGVSVEDQEYADKRIPYLLDTPAACRMVSYEPALGPVDFTRIADGTPFICDALRGQDLHPAHMRTRLDWVVAGGESGPGSRHFDIAWARQTVRACQEAGVPVFVKQLGAQPLDSRRSVVGGWAPGDPEPDTRVRLKDRKGGDMAKWPEDLRVREFPALARRHETSSVAMLAAHGATDDGAGSFSMVQLEASGSPEVVGAALDMAIGAAASMRGAK